MSQSRAPTIQDSGHYYHDKPVFGLDIGYSSVKVMQLMPAANNSHRVVGYGVARFDPALLEAGLLKDPVGLARVIYELFTSGLVGEITTRRVALAVPVSRTFNRGLTLPPMKARDLAEAVRLEAEQYIPLPLDELYTDYQEVGRSAEGVELLAVAAPKKLIDPLLPLCRLLNLEPVLIETSIAAGGRLFLQAEQSDQPTVLLDLGSLSTDITIFDGNLVVTGTVPGGGDSFSKLIAEALKVTHAEAHIIKTKYGLGVSKRQAEIVAALTPFLEQLGREVRRMIRYYEERRSGSKRIAQIVTLGGGANMPGLSDYLTNWLRLPARMCDPWQKLEFGDLQPPGSAEKSMFVTAAGLALLDPRQVVPA